MSLNYKQRGRMGELLADAEAQGCTVDVRRNGHLVIVTPQGKKVFTSATTSDWRAWKNLRAKLRRIGVAL